VKTPVQTCMARIASSGRPVRAGQQPQPLSKY
jgi:hypothetical protein